MAENKRIILKLSGEALGNGGQLFDYNAFQAAAQNAHGCTGTGV